jgi:hypothetical protein
MAPANLPHPKSTSAPEAPVKHLSPRSAFDWTLPGALLLALGLFAKFFVASQIQGLDNDRSVQFVQIGLVVVAIAVIYWGIELSKEKRAQAFQVLRNRLLLVLGFGGLLGYFNFGHMHFGSANDMWDIHIWDTYHYYMGAKYFPEVGYDNLYECAAVVDGESGRREEVERRVMTELKTNELIRAASVLDRPERCKSAFTAERWKAFTADLNLFRSWVSEGRWSEIHKDHGYNATPVWTIAGYFLANTAPASREQLVWLIILDPLYIIASAALIWWAFGFRGFALAMLALGTNFPNRYYWTGGAFLRHDWLFYLLASLCLLKKAKPALAGAAFSYTVLLRLFPGLAAFGPLLAAVVYFRKHRAVDRAFVRFVVSGLCTSIVLVTLSLGLMGGKESWIRFAQNTVKHANTPLTNHMGLRTVLSYRMDSVGSQLTDGAEIDPWGPWKAARLEHWNNLKPLFVLLFLGALVMIYRALSATGPSLWLGLSLGIGLIVFGAELTCYYYCFLMGMAVLASERREVGLIVATLSLLTLLVEVGAFAGQSHQLDEQYVVMSAATVLAVVAIWYLYSASGNKILLEAEPATTARELFELGVKAPAAAGSKVAFEKGSTKNKRAR